AVRFWQVGNLHHVSGTRKANLLLLRTRNGQPSVPRILHALQARPIAAIIGPFAVANRYGREPGGAPGSKANAQPVRRRRGGVFCWLVAAARRPAAVN